MESLVQQFERQRVCVLIPTYNNATTLKKILTELDELGVPVIVVNDGSTDSTREILDQFNRFVNLQYSPNQGKGIALRRGFSEAVNRGYDYVITLDSDGQHFVKDLEVFMAALETNPGSLIIGARNMNQSSVPSKSSFGHRFSNFWYQIETGIKLPDTQSGYRLYPVSRMRYMTFITRRFEFEIEVIVLAAWEGIPVISVPVAVYYAPPGERVSHFRPFMDFTRISILNTFLVLIAYVYIKPRDFLRKLFLRRKWKEVFVEELFNPGQSPIRKSVSVAFGVFMGIIPIWGFQLVAAIFLAILFRLNKGLVILFANISIPPMIPLIIYASYRVGQFWMPAGTAHPVFTKPLTISGIRSSFNSDSFKQYLVGSISLAVIAALFAGFITFVLLNLFSRKNRAVL